MLLPAPTVYGVFARFEAERVNDVDSDAVCQHFQGRQAVVDIDKVPHFEWLVGHETIHRSKLGNRDAYCPAQVRRERTHNGCRH